MDNVFPQDPKPDDFIFAFDQVLDFIYGRRYGRDNEYQSDKKTAQKWIDEGVLLPVATAVFYMRMFIMYEKFQRDFDTKSRQHIPHSLSVFEENVYAAMASVKLEGQHDRWELEWSKWRSRLNTFYKKGLWLEDHWGPRPGSENCRVPPRLLAEAAKRKEE